MKKTFLVSFLFICLLTISQACFAYDDETTHPGITEQVVEFYNLNNEVKISSTDKELIIQGSIDEDNNPATRPLNHFYDPQRNMGINDYRNAIEWATEVNNGNEFIWDKSITKYALGDREGALIGLGHILHLLEDMTVPDHVRNDPHMGTEGIAAWANTGDSLYENWAQENKTRQAMKGTAQAYKSMGYKIRSVGDNIESYFKDLAGYTNNNYVSPDTISNGVYPFPEVKSKKNGYAYGEDYFFYDSHKLYIEYVLDGGEVVQGLVNVKTNNTSVLEEYFTRLSKMAILDGTGAVELFMSQAENARAEYLEAEAKKQAEAAALEAERLAKLTEGSLFSQLWYRLNYAVTDTAGAIAGAVSNTVSGIASAVYNGSALALNNTANFVNGLTYTGNVLATIGAQAVERTVSSVSKKVVLYIRENSSNFITPAVAYTPPASNSPSITQSDFSRLVSILSTINNSNESDDTSDEKPVRHSSSGHRDRTPEPEPVLVVIEPEVTSTATTTEEIATTTEEVATTTEPIIDTTAPEVTFGPVLKCQDTLSDEVCLLAATSSVMFDFSFLSTSTDISFYTLSVDDGDPEDFASATTSENTMSMELTEDYEYIISLTATDISGNTSATTSAKIILERNLIFMDAYWSTEFMEAENSLIVLRNNMPYSINLKNWSLVTENGLFDLSLRVDGKIPANGEYVLRNTESGVTEGVDQIYEGQIVRADRFLYLKYFSDIMTESFLGINAPM